MTEGLVCNFVSILVVNSHSYRSKQCEGSHSIAAFFDDVSRPEFENVIAVEITANLWVTHLMLLLMIKPNTRTKEHWGVIIKDRSPSRIAYLSRDVVIFRDQGFS